MMMRGQRLFSRRVSAGLFALLLAAAPAFSAEGPATVMCIDISASPQAYRVLKLAATPVNAADEQYYSLSGSHQNSAGEMIGLAVGTARMGSDGLTSTVTASSSVSGKIESTTYQFNLDASSLGGTYQSIIQSSSGIAVKSGQATMLSCTAPLTEFSDNPGGSNDCTDKDGDGSACVTVFGTAVFVDCDDNDPHSYPGAPEVCGDGIDQDCDGTPDDGCNAPNNDADGDGYNSKASGGNDCNDNNPAIKPGAQEICGDNIDQDCDGVADDGCSASSNDADGDGYNSKSSGGTDCDDSKPAINPGAAEICGNNVDENCDGKIDACVPVSEYPAFDVKSSATLAQRGSGLVWQKVHYDSKALNLGVDWTGAVKYCQNLSLDGKNGWRLPTLDELMSILDSRYTPKIDPRFTASGDVYLTSTEFADNPRVFVYGVDFGKGQSVIKQKVSFYSLVRCVHDPY